MSTVIVVPAYGRRYRTNIDIRASWYRGEDFRVCMPGNSLHNRYVSANEIPELQQAGYAYVELRYDIKHRSYTSGRKLVLMLVMEDYERAKPDPEREEWEDRMKRIEAKESKPEPPKPVSMFDVPVSKPRTMFD